MGSEEMEWNGLDHNLVAQDRDKRLGVVDLPVP
jgi:hypothetical protein